MAEAGIRTARDGDIPALAAIYDHYIEHTPITFDLERFGTSGRRAWFEAFAARGRHRLLVAEAAGEVSGYACSHTFRPKGAYQTSVETSVYLAPDALGRGLGTRLYAALFEALAAEDVHRAFAGITLPNDASVALHQRFGFEHAGTFHEVGRKFDRYWDVAWYAKTLGT